MGDLLEPRMLRFARRAWGPLFALLLLGCPPMEIGDAGPPALVLGTGETAFVEVADGGELELIHGPQGGWHVIVAARLSGFDPDGMVLTLGVYEGDTTLIELPMAIAGRRLVRDGLAYLKLNDFMIFDIVGPDEIVGHEVEVRAVIRSGEVVIAMDSLQITVVDRL